MAAHLAMRGISRRFPGVLALDNVNFDVQPGEVHALVGENGAGKSTLINIMAGVLQPSAGTVEIGGRPVQLPTPLSAQQAGISVIFQEFNLLPHLSVAENIFINREPVQGLRINWPEMRRRSQEVLAMLDVAIDPRTEVSNLPVAHQQLVEIARALSFQAKVIVMDEPTAALSEREVEHLLKLVRSLADTGVSVVYVSHKLAEVFAVADRITVLRDGRQILTEQRAALTERQVIGAMVGRELVHTSCPERFPGRPVLEVDDLRAPGASAGVSFELREGEVVALAGLMGCGNSEVMQALFGLQPATGHVRLNGKAMAISGPGAGIRSGLGFVPDDRKGAGILPDLSVMHNTTIGILERVKRTFLLDARRERAIADEYGQKLNIRYSSPNQMISGLSGGNQQKVILARALAENCRVLLLCEPTRGVDVGAKAEIYTLIDGLVQAGMAVLLQSSELPEVLRLANRCLVFAQGRVMGELSGSELTQAAVMELATGLAAAPATPKEVTA
jgi:ABC-type sugar transport system ATPase subunit